MRVQELLTATGIEKIVWIDDRFAEVDDVLSDDKILSIIKEQAELGSIEELKKTFVPVTGGLIDFEEPPEVVYATAEKSLNQDHYNAIREVLNQSGSYESTVEADPLDGIPDDIVIHRLSYESWQNSLQEHLPCNINTLFLVDKNFENEKEGSPTQGFEIVKQVYQEPTSRYSSHCILFTHEATPNDQEEAQLSSTYLDEINEGSDQKLPAAALMVVSKARGNDHNDLANTLHFTFMRKIIYAVSKGLSEEASKESNSVIESFLSLNMHNANNVFFDSTEKEGILEVELFYRILSSQWRQSMYRYALENNDFAHMVSSGRNISQVRRNSLEDVDLDERSLNEFRAIRKGEFWINGDVLNKSFLPIAGGDVFEIDIPTKDKVVKQQFVLLGQACELLIRHHGERKLNDAFIVPITEKANLSTKELNAYRAKSHLYIIQELKAVRTIHQVELNQSYSINLAALDICSYNENGELNLSAESEIQEYLIPPGSKLRFDKIKQILQSGRPSIQDSAISALFNAPKPLISDVKDIHRVTMHVEERAISAPIKRIRRLSQTEAEQLLSAYHSHRARSGSDYDFTS